MAFSWAARVAALLLDELGWFHDVARGGEAFVCRGELQRDRDVFWQGVPVAAGWQSICLPVVDSA